MSSLTEYLIEKREVVAAREACITRGELAPTPLAARVSAEGRSGVRRIRVRDHQVITDSPPDFAGYDLGPSSPELQLGVLGSCLAHSYLIQAALQQVEVETLEVEVTGQIDARAGRPSHEATPVFPHNLAYTVHIVSPASREAVETLGAAVERTCPSLNLLKSPQVVHGTVDHRAPDQRSAEAQAA